MATATYANIYINYPSNDTSLEFNILDADNYGTYDISSSLNNCTFDQAQGRITVGEDGTYLIIAANAVQINAGTTNQVKTRIKVDGVEKYSTDYYNVHVTFGPRTERTCHKILSINSGSYIEITLEENGSNNINTLAGTSVYVQKLYSDFGTFELTGDNDNSTTRVFPFDTSVEPGKSSTLSSSFNGGISQAPTSGKLQTANGGPSLLLANMYFDGPPPPPGSPVLDIEYFKNGSSQWTTDLRKNSADEPIEGTTIAFENYSANDNVYLGVDFGQGGTVGGFTMASSSLSLIRYPGDIHYAFVRINNPSDVLAGMGTFYNLFKEDNYTGSGFSAVSNTNGITYDSQNGRFTIGRDGDYLFITTPHLLTPNNTNMQYFFRLYKDGASGDDHIFEFSTNIDNLPDPAERTNVFALSNITAGSYFEYKSAATDDQKYKEGTSIAIIELTDLCVGDPALFSEGVANNLISDDFTINTFAQDVLSSQYERAGTAQVPFLLGARGPLTLRRTISPPAAWCSEASDLSRREQGPSPAIKQGSDDD